MGGEEHYATRTWCILEEKQMVCIYCRREIKDDERQYYSRQAGMKGLYHWDCFVEACRLANRAGANEIENISVSDDVYEYNPSYSLAYD